MPSLTALFSRKDAAADAAPGPDESGPAHGARVRARRRLIGAVVLLALGLTVFPSVFDTRPRPLAPDIPIEAAQATKSPPAAERPVPRPPLPDAGQDPPLAAPTPPPPAAPAASGPGMAAAERVAAVAPRTPPAVAPVAAASTPPIDRAPAPGAGSAATAAAAGTASAPPKAPRFVVQVGAYTDALTLREARQRVEKLGLRTYTQEIETDAGKRTRVRVGPFDTRAEAERAGATLKAGGMPAHVLAL
jgi:DedD protein